MSISAKKYIPAIGILCLLKFGVHWIGNQNYGFHRDELLHLSVSEHLAWGYMEFPPFIGWIGSISHFLFGWSLPGMRLFPTLAGVAIVILCCLMAREFGGKSKSVLLAGICVLAFLPFYRNHTLFQPVAFNQLYWTLGFYLLVRFIRTENKNLLLLLGLVGGLGLLNKYTMLVWGLGIAAGFLAYDRGKLFKSGWLYLAGGFSLLLLLPNILWQAHHDFPILQHLQVLKEDQLAGGGTFDFVLSQLELPFTLIVSLLGLGALFRDKQLKKFRAAGVAVSVIFFTMWIMQSKAYYFFAVYPVLFAAGSVKVEQLLSARPGWNYAIAALLILPVIPFIPEAAPVLPIEQYVTYAGKQEHNGRIELTGDYADMFGWEEQVALVDSVYRSLSDRERANAVLWAENYGEAGALKILGDAYGLPDPISRHGTFWLWGYGDPDAEVWISLGNEQSSVEHVFEEVELIKIITHKYAIEEENGIPLYLCRKPKVNIPRWWQEYRDHIFD